MSYLKVKIGDFLKRIKRPFQLVDDIDYKLVTVKLNHNGVVLRTLKKGTDIKSKMYEVKTGDFILSGIDARNGAFGIIPSSLDGAIVTNDFWYFDIDEKIINKQLFLELTATSWFDHICKRGSDGTTQRIRLQKDKFFNQNIILPHPTKQDDLLIKIQGVRTNLSQLNEQITTQKQTITQLKQSILQDAISGKLTEQWRKENPDVEPANELLKRIKAEKEKLVKEKRIKKEKPLPPIKPEDLPAGKAGIPFELPDGWVWCRLGEILFLSEYGTSQKAYEVNEGVPVLAMGNIFDGKVNLNFNKRLDFNSSDLPKLFLKNNDVLFNRTNSWELVGKTGIFSGVGDHYTFASYLIRLRFNEGFISPHYVNYYLNSTSFRRTQIEPQIVQQCGQANFNGTKLKNALFPLPPITEQNHIVNQVKNQNKLFNELKNQLNQSQEDAGLLMQAVLKEAFENR